MRCYFDLNLGKLVQLPGYTSLLAGMELKRGDAAALEVSFHRGSLGAVAGAEELGEMAEMIFVVKAGAADDEDVLLLADDWTLDEVTGIYSAALAANFAALSTLLGDAAYKDLLGELTFTTAGGSGSGDGEAMGPATSQNIKVRVYNDLWKGFEGTPLVMPTPEEWLAEQLGSPLSITTVGDARFPLLLPRCRSLSVNDGSGTGSVESLSKCVDAAISMTGLAAATVAGSGLTDLSSITFNDLQGCGAITFSTWPALATIAFPELVYCGAIDIRPNTAILTALTFPKLKYMLGSPVLTSDSGLVTLAFPELIYCSTAFAPGNLANITTFTLPKLKKVNGNFAPSSMAKITSLSTPELTHVNSVYSPATMALLTTLSAAKLAYVFGNYAPDTMVKLETITCPLLVHIGGNFAPNIIGTSGTKTLKLSFPELKKIVGSFAPSSSNTRLSSCSFPKLETVVGHLVPHLPYISATLANPCAAADDIIDTTADHPFQVGDYIKFTALTGGGSPCPVVDKVYKVHANNFAARTFQVADVGTGAVVGFTSNITAGTVCIAQRVVFEKLTTVNGTINLVGSSSGSGTSFAEIDFPEIVNLHIDSLSNCSGITKLEAPKAVYVSLGSFTALTNLTALNFPLAQAFTCSGLSASGLVSLDLPSLTSPGAIELSGCTSLSQVNLGSGAFYSCHLAFNGCALTSATIKHILARCASFPGTWPGYTIDLSGGTNRGYDDWLTDLSYAEQQQMYSDVQQLRMYDASVYINQESF